MAPDPPGTTIPRGPEFVQKSSFIRQNTGCHGARGQNISTLNRAREKRSMPANDPVLITGM
ncbi:MAG: hypothetical protein NTV68_08220 [Methanomicrobiales archaeon]|nr:hypothetical protein [Methanomicrobiales archaeon]